MTEIYDLVVIGAGPGGYAAAIRAAQRGLRTGLVERAELGGVCLNLGCIPSKAMLQSGEVLRLVRDASRSDGSTDETAAAHAAADYSAAVERREAAVAHLLQGLTTLLRSNGVTVIRGEARLRDAHTLEVSAPAGAEELGFRNLVLATGSRSAPLPVPGAHLPGVVDSDGALTLRQPPGRAVVIGGGAVGVEWAEIWHAFGSEVTVLELLPQLVPTEDHEIARELLRTFTRRGITCHVGAQVQEIRSAPGGLSVVASIDGATQEFAADTVLAAVGRRANLDGLDLAAVGIAAGPRGIATDEHMRTSVPHIFAVGDVTGRFLLAHVASHQGLVAAEMIAGHDEHRFDDSIVPAAIFTHPEIASVGLRERDALAQGLRIRVGRFPFAALGRAVAVGEPAGYVKMVADEVSGVLLGVHIIGARAADLIGEASLALRLKATLQDLADTIHVHPTFSEALLEAAWVTAGTPLHVPPRRVRTASGGEPAAPAPPASAEPR
jgi:dihydrolipoamide dehydrogenase